MTDAATDNTIETASRCAADSGRYKGSTNCATNKRKLSVFHKTSHQASANECPIAAPRAGRGNRLIKL
jgi:hypothetical protein